MSMCVCVWVRVRMRMRVESIGKTRNRVRAATSSSSTAAAEVTADAAAAAATDARSHRTQSYVAVIATKVSFISTAIRTSRMRRHISTFATPSTASHHRWFTLHHTRGFTSSLAPTITPALTQSIVVRAWRRRADIVAACISNFAHLACFCPCFGTRIAVAHTGRAFGHAGIVAWRIACRAVAARQGRRDGRGRRKTMRRQITRGGR